MRLRILLPTHVELDDVTREVSVEAADGAVNLQAKHPDMVTALVPGVLRYETLEGNARYVGIDSGTLVKCGPEIVIATTKALKGSNPDKLRRTIDREFVPRSERDKLAQSECARLEADLVQRLLIMTRPNDL